MEELKYQSKIYTDSMSLFEHIIAFKNAEDGYGDDEFVIKINYKNSGVLIELVDHLKDYYGDYYGDGWVETVMDSIWSGGWSISDAQQKIFDESYDYWKEKVDKEKLK